MSVAPQSSPLPACHASEVAVLYLALHHPEVRDRIVTHLKEIDFHFAQTQQFFRLIAECVENHAPVSQLGIAESLLKLNPPETAGILIADWNDIALDGWAPPSFLDWHIEQLIDAATRRALSALAGRIADEATETLPEFSSRELIDSAQERLRRLRRESSNASESDIKDLFADFEEDYGSTTPPARSIPIGLPTMDNENRGPFGSELVVIAARPSVGKTALGLQAVLAAAQDNAPAYVFSMETGKLALRERCIAHLSGIPINVIRERQLSEPQLTAYSAATTRFKGICRINFGGRLQVSEICDNSRTAHRVLGIRILMVDYLGLIQAPPKFQKDYEAIGVITRELKLLALELDIPVLLLAQFNRESEKAGRGPQLSDLARSGSIEQDADQVWSLDAPDGIGEPARTLTVLKGRNTGAGFKLNLRFTPEIQRFEEVRP